MGFFIYFISHFFKKKFFCLFIILTQILHPSSLHLSTHQIFIFFFNSLINEPSPQPLSQSTNLSITQPSINQLLSTNLQSTNPQSTNPQSTNPQSTNPQSTNPQSTNPQSTNPQSTNPQSTTLPSFNPLHPSSPFLPPQTIQELPGRPRLLRRLLHGCLLQQ